MNKGKKRCAASEDPEDIEAVKRSRSTLKEELHPDAITIGDLLSGSFSFQDLKIIARHFGITPIPRSGDGLKWAIIQHLYPMEKQRSMSPQSTCDSISECEDTRPRSDCDEPRHRGESVNGGRPVEVILDQVASNLEDLSRLSVINFSRHEDRVSNLYARMALMEKLGGDLSVKVEQTARATEANRSNLEQLNHSHEALGSTVEVMDETHTDFQILHIKRLRATEQVATEWAQARQQLDNWHGQVTTAFQAVNVQFETIATTLENISKSVSTINKGGDTDSMRTTAAFLIDHDVCGLILHGHVLDQLTQATSVFIQISDRPEDLARVMQSCNDQLRQSIRGFPHNVARVRRLSICGLPHNIGLAFNALRDWIAKVRNGERIIAL
ncbi:uncharacterized protein EV422DRAFT_504255 [Fimicolochytrium jonesii]|uniref:uncharacterized protein n=1 Tax=Fimicolochytrium jonesii TaxID=1396493 RepID=UPI0022FE218D|nr:uncharacterized protein EV422DRAFT_504255 [Fimicolochytrium jonesii]KAI8824218.1 hypothetical protein EV422DRAFT_504255 [Fimicolochytrium jonesii]